jgi:hypothetical protein
MQKRVNCFWAAVAAICLLGIALVAGASAVDDQLTAKRRVFSTVGPGLRAVRRGPDGTFYVLASPGSYVSIYDAKGTLLKKIPDYAQNTGPAAPELRAIQFGEDMDVGANGTVYVADRGPNEIKVWEQNGNAHAIHVTAPLSVAALPEGEVAVSTLHEERLITVFGPNGRVAREIGEVETVSSRPEMNRFLSVGHVASDPQGHIYYGYTYLPEPLVRQYDRFGYGGLDFEFTGLDAFPEAQAARKEIERQEKKETAPSFRPVLTAFGVDPVNGDLWMALHNTLLHFDKDGNRRSEYQIYMPDGARLEATVILVEEERLLIGADPLGVYEFPRPDRKY